MEETAEKTTRKQQILDAAFSVVQTTDRWSLAEIAAKIGISKTAIYRHFKNRAEIEEALNDVLARDLLTVIENSGFTPQTTRQAMIAFLKSHPGHLFLIMHNSCAIQDYEQGLYAFMEKESPRIAAFSAHIASLPKEQQEETVMDILKNTVSVLLAGFQFPGIETMQAELSEILERGLPGFTLPPDSRLDGLEAVSRIGEGEIAANNKLFDAIAASIKEFGITHTTIEKIAEKMGGAKSSLYFHFKNKNEMLGELVRRETETIITLCAHRAGRGLNFAEQLFIIMEVQANYLLLKPEILPVFGWIRYETIRQNPAADAHRIDTVDMIKHYHIGDLGPSGIGREMRAIALLKWASILSTSAIIQGLRQHADEKTLRKNIRLMYKSMLIGDRRK